MKDRVAGWSQVNKLLACLVAHSSVPQLTLVRSTRLASGGKY